MIAQPTSVESPVHRLHPLAKLSWLVGATAAALLCSEPAVVIVLVVTAVAALWIARLPPWRLPGRRLYVLLALSLLIVNALLSDRGERLIGPVTTGGLARGSLAAGRIISVILFSQLFVATTDAASLGQALIAVRLPYRWAFALVTALRLAPLFRSEANTVYWAQRARGVRYDRGPVRRRWLMLRKLLLPLVVSSLRMAAALSATMENRCFGLHRRRTSLHPLPFTFADAVAMLAGPAGCAALLVWDYC